jgi:hypothetical protein
MQSTDLNYLNGFLQAMALVNVGTNHGCWYLIEPVERKKTLDESLQAHFAEFYVWLESRYGTKGHTVQVQALRDWKVAVSEVAHRWFFEMECSPKLKEDYQPNIVVKDLVEKMEKIFVGDVWAWSVEGGSSDIGSSDLLLEDLDGYYLLRFSFSD